VGKTSSNYRQFRERKRFARLEIMLVVVWSVITLPFRLIAWLVEICGRVVGLLLGFMLMIVGVALGAGPFFMIGIPLFVVGLIIMLRCLG
jgi:hypothetical protein